MLKITSSFKTSKLISTSKSNTIKRLDSSNSIVDEVVVKVNIVDKAKTETFQPKMAKFKNLV